jgi:lipoprotein-anchoring transpeptidase ErfK/SrfK
VGKALVVDQERQVLRVYEDGREIHTLPASTGQAPYYTPAFTGRVRYYVGTFYSFGLWADDAWYVFMGAGEIMIHSLPYTESTDAKIYEGEEHLGVRPSSHGCIRLHPDDARWLTAWGPGGVPIVITPPLVGKEWR